MKRILALDIGTVRIGVAVSDPLGVFARGVAVLNAGKGWMDELDGLVKEYGPGILLVGHPLRTDGSRGPEALKVEAVAEELAARYPDLEVELYDERFSTAIANRALIEGDVSRKNRKGKVDKVAAALILQSRLERGRGAQS
ncbi:MAG: Holliday junction resolvase RuvX [Aminivibrio sp.]|jgi:putative Holliday junction resolvase